MGKLCLHSSSFFFDRIIIKVADNQDRHKSSVKFNYGLNQTSHFWVACPLVMKISYFWTWISLKPVGQSWSNFMCSVIGVGERLHKVFVIAYLFTLCRLDQNWFPWQQKAPIDLSWGKWCLPLFSFVFDPIFLILAGNEDMHKISDEFEFWPDRTTDYGVSCHEV